LFGSTYLVPIFLQIGLQYGAAEAGLVLLPAGLVLALAMPVTGRLADRYPTHRLVVLGLLVLAASFALLATVNAQTRYLQLVLWVIVGRIGLALVMPSLSLSAMHGIGRDDIAQGTSTINFMRQLGGAVGVSLTGIALEWRLAAHGVTLHDDGVLAAARVRAFDETFVGVAAICAVAAVIARRLRPAAVHDR
ncbi:MAG TPA: MFS transporter, partial [Burkholderiaceae bacterium]|nr:MFS transporter [Burkholderiaceae bacterium]